MCLPSYYAEGYNEEGVYLYGTTTAHGISNMCAKLEKEEKKRKRRAACNLQRWNGEEDKGFLKAAKS
jgi:hypothetical protein